MKAPKKLIYILTGAKFDFACRYIEVYLKNVLNF